MSQNRLLFNHTYETFYYFNRQHDFNITFSVNLRTYRGSHVPMGYRSVSERDPERLFADRYTTLAWGGTSYVDAPAESVAAALLQHLGQVDELFVSIGGAWPAEMTNPGAPLESRIAQLEPFQALVARNRTPVLVTAAVSGLREVPQLRDDPYDNTDIAQALGWRILDRRGVDRALQWRLEQDWTAKARQRRRLGLGGECIDSDFTDVSRSDSDLAFGDVDSESFIAMIPRHQARPSPQH